MFTTRHVSLFRRPVVCVRTRVRKVDSMLVLRDMLVRCMSRLLWFHAFNRSTVGEVIEVLRRGPAPNPNPKSTTRLNEQELGIRNSAYAYLGKTVPDFGDVAFAFPFDEIVGEMSPFDTGGLVKHVVPVRDLDRDGKRQFLDAFTFSSRNRKRLVADYPGTSRRQLQAYLKGTKPGHASGPHDVWPSGKIEPTVAAIWNPSNSWQAWTWEGRAPGRLTFSTLHRWSCAATLFIKIRDYAERSTVKADEPFFDALLGAHVRGGVSQMVAGLEPEQLA